MFRHPHVLKSFQREDSGSISVIFGLMTITLFAFIGAALDYGKWHNAFLHVEATMDRALLAAGRQLQTEPAEKSKAIEVAQTYFNEAVSKGIEIVNPVAEFKIAESGMGIEGSVTGAVKTPFLSLISIQDLAVNSKQQVAFNTGGGSGSTLELAIMLDVTGSMCANGEGPCTSSTKLNALKDSAKDLLNIVVRDGSNARAALVPFSTRVRLADGLSPDAGVLMQKMTNLAPTWSGYQVVCTSGSGSGGSEGNGNWSCSAVATQHFNNIPVAPCVSDRNGPQQYTDAAPGPNAWLNAHAGNRFPLSEDSTDAPLSSGLGATSADPANQWNYIDGGWCADIMAPNSVMPLTNKMDELEARIEALEAYGSTGGALGTAVTWYMLSPNWSAVWGGASAPGPYSDLTATNANGKPKLRKIAVLMTDGDYNTLRTDKNATPQTVSNDAKSLCANMKAQGIEIFTVGFELDQLPSDKKAMAIDTLQTCGTDLDHFYNSLDANQLKQSFRDIALKLSELYVEK